MNVVELIRSDLRELEPYRSARHDTESGILLDANEHAYAIGREIDGISLNRYPDPLQRRLRLRLAQLNDVRVDQVFVGVGSDEVIDLVIRLFCRSGYDSIATIEPTYGMYRVSAAINGVRRIVIPLGDDFQLDLDTILCAIEPTTKLVFCCSPNNPTGNLLDRSKILRLCGAVSAIVVVDEAYIDFASVESLAGCVESTPNLLVLRTLSKGWGLAGVRLGYAVANAGVVDHLLKIKAPYNINVLTERYALTVLGDLTTYRDAITGTLKERERLTRELAAFSDVLTVFPSEANFLLVRTRAADRIYRELRSRGIIVRAWGGRPMLEECLRITVGAPQENDLLLSTFQEILA